MTKEGYAIDETNRRIPPFLTLANSYVTFPVTPLLAVDRGDFSVSAWIRTANSGTNVILDHRIEDSGTVHGWAFFTYQGRLNSQLSHPGVLAYGGTACNYVHCSEHLRQLPIVADGVWHHVAVTIEMQASATREIEANIIPCRDYEPTEPHVSEPIALEERQGHRQNQAAALSTPEKLIGVWNYWVSIAPTSYRLQVFLDGNRGLVGRYLIPADNDSLFEIRVYESSERGRPVLTLAQTYCCESQPASSYYAVLTGRLDRDDLITGSFVDLDNNQGTFTLEKQ